MKSEEMKKIEELRDLVEQAIVAFRSALSVGDSKVIMELTSRFDTHMQNHTRDMQSINQRFDSIDKKVDPVFDAFQKASGFKAVALLILTTVGSFFGVALAYKNLFHK